MSLSRAFAVDLSKDQARVVADPVPEWVIGEPGGISIERLVLVSMRRATTGCWVPCIRLVNDQESELTEGSARAQEEWEESVAIRGM